MKELECVGGCGRKAECDDDVQGYSCKECAPTLRDAQRLFIAHEAKHWTMRKMCNAKGGEA